MTWAEGKFGEFVVFLGSQFLFIFAPLDTLLSMGARAHSFIHGSGLLFFSLSFLTCTLAHSSPFKSNPQRFPVD